MKLLLTGGLGYIGSHTCIELCQSGYQVVLIDNLSNSSMETLERINTLVSNNVTFYNIDIRDQMSLEDLFNRHVFDGVIHFAGLKSVNKSISNPIDYYSNNVCGTVILIEVMKKFGCKTFIFSSSATVYGEPKSVPISEDFPLSSLNPYGHSKLIIEDLLKNICDSDSAWSIAILRYFNPIGAHKSGMIGENPIGLPNNLMPYISQVAIGKREKLYIFGDNFKTSDGTGVRDYIHVMDVVDGHISAFKAIRDNNKLLILNLGTGKGYSVLEVVSAFENASGKKIPIQIVDRRAGDVSECFANPSLAFDLIKWKSKRELDEMCEDSWRWQRLNPNGYN
jgi:UDP-glucose 4-epimerase